MNDIRENAMFLTLLCIVCAWLYSHWLISVSLCTLCLLLHSRKKSLLIMIPLFLLLSFPRYQNALPALEKGTVAEVHEKYAIIQNSSTRVLVYTETPLEFDAEVQFDDPYYEEIRSAQGFFLFDFSAYLKRRGVYFQTDESCLKIVQHSGSIRSRLQRRIGSCFEGDTAAYLNKILLNISDDGFADSFLFRQGFAAVGFLMLCESLLSLFLKEKTKKKCSLFLSLSLAIVFHMPFGLLQHTVFRLMRMLPLNSREQFCLATVTVLVLKPQEAVSAAFLLPLLFRVSSLIRDLDDSVRTTLILLYQSFTYQRMSPLQSILFPFFMRINGFFFLIACLQVIVPDVSFMSLFRLSSYLDVLVNLFSIKGSCLGIGMTAYLILAVYYLSRKNLRKLLPACTLLFQLFGLFHPCAEITFINVGQGDSILIRQPFNTMNMLVDTGKPEMKDRLYTFLDSKGIRNLDTLVITHEDSDHSGNMECVSQDYHPAMTVTEHQSSFTSGSILFYDLNRIDEEDRNRSSVVLYFRMNGMYVMLMGDADQVTEEDIIYRYGNLKCDVLKLSHHGSATGNCDRFLDAVRCSVAIISSGAFEIYHHPSPQTVRRLRKRHIPYVDTKDEGDITILCLPGVNLLITSQGKVAIIAT